MSVSSQTAPRKHVDSRLSEGRRRRGSVIDLFCGAGGLSHGFKLEGFDVVAGVDIDENAGFPSSETTTPRSYWRTLRRSTRRA